jgi:hypothetical protein
LQGSGRLIASGAIGIVVVIYWYRRGVNPEGRMTKTRAFVELLIDCEEDWTLRAVLVGMLREGDR